MKNHFSFFVVLWMMLVTINPANSQPQSAILLQRRISRRPRNLSLSFMAEQELSANRCRIPSRRNIIPRSGRLSRSGKKFSPMATSLDAVEKVLRYFEDDPKFNAGIGELFTSDSTHELDASIMDGRDLSCGAVAGVEHIAHPISLARLVMEKSPHVLLAYHGAEEFARKMGIELVPNSYFDTPLRKQQLEEYLKKQKVEDPVHGKGNHGTCGCVALDEYGNLAAGTSTGGMTGKMPGRIGDSPLIGDGTDADNKTCAVSGTGWGEKFIKHVVAFNISALMAYSGMSLQDAVHEIIYDILQPDDGGVIAVDKDGNYAMEFNTSGMFRGVATSSGTLEVKIWK